MRTAFNAPTLIVSLSLALVMGVLDRVFLQDDDAFSRPQDSFVDAAPADPLLARLTEEIEGAWMLMSIETADEYIEPGTTRGFALFADGYHTLLFGGDEPSGVTFGPQYRVAINAGAYRYRISPRYTLQISSIMSLSNMTADGRAKYFRSGEVAEYGVEIVDGTLELRSEDGGKRTYRRLGKTQFPRVSIDKLQEAGGGWEFVDDPADGR